MSDLVIADISQGVGPLDYDEFVKHVDVIIFRGQNGHYGVDTQFANHWREFGAREKLRGIYHLHYLLAADQDNKRQAELALSLLDQHKAHEPEVRNWGDWERDNANLSVKDGRDAVWKYINTFERGIDHRLGAYTSAGFWDVNIANKVNGNTDIPEGRDLWVANVEVVKPRLPYDWYIRYGENGYLMHQYTWRAKIPGAKGDVDLTRFNGAREKFEKHFGIKVPPRGGSIVTPPTPPKDVERIEIAHLGRNETLRMRNKPFGDIVGMTWNGCKFRVMGTGIDPQGRTWFQVGPEIFVASWYAEPI